LGWDTISVVHFRGGKNDARIYELTQSFTRAGNTVLQRAKIVAELVPLILGESRAKKLAGGRQPGDKGISKSARELGLPRDDISRCMAIASISNDAMEKAEALNLDDNESALLKIAKKKPDEQVAEAEQLGTKKKGPKKPKFGKKDEASYAKLADVWADATEFEEAFREATENARRKFISALQKISSRLAKGEEAVEEVEDKQDEEAVEEQDEQNEEDHEDEQDGQDEDDWK
jgi:hypothetical protein